MIDRELFEKGIDEYRPVTMWFWNDVIDEAEICRQIDQFHEQRINEFFIHPLSAFEEEYLSGRYFSLVDIAVRHASKRGMKLWIYDEYNWPSGTAGGRLIRDYPEYRMVVTRYLNCSLGPGEKKTVEFPGSFVTAQAVYGETIRDIADEGTLDTDKGTFAWQNPDSSPCLLYVFYEENQGGLVASAIMSSYSWNQEGYLDTRNPEAVRKFLDMTHEQYYARFGDHFGTTIPGVFTDEVTMTVPSGGAPDTIPWTKGFGEIFIEANGYDLIPRLSELVTEAGDYRRTRHDYWRTLTTRFSTAYAKQVADWCTGHGVKLTGHYAGEELLIADLLESGSTFESLQHFHIPAIDSIFSKSFITHENFNYAGKMIASVAEHTGAERTLCETYTGSGWDLTMEEMKHIFHRLAVLGVNMIQFMGAYYSLRGVRKRLPVSYPPSHSFQLPVWPYYGLFSDYISRICYANSLGVHGAEIAVLQPTTTFWSEYGLRHDFMFCYVPDEEKPYGDLVVTESTVHGTVNALLQIRRDFDLLHEPSFLQADITDGVLLFRGHAYKQLIVPSLVSLTGALWDKISAFIAVGGRVCFVNLLPAHSPDRGEIASSLERLCGLSPTSAAAEVGERLAAGVARSTRIADCSTVTHIVSNELKKADNAGFRGALEKCLAWLEPRLSLSEPCDHVYVHHRKLGDQDVFVLVNDKPVDYEGTIRLHRNGCVTVYDPQSGNAYDPECTSGDGFEDVRFPLSGLQAVVIEVTPKPACEAAQSRKAGTQEPGETLELNGEWQFAPDKGLNFMRFDMEVSAGESGVWHPVPGYIFPSGAGFDPGTRYEARATFRIAQLPGLLELVADPEEDGTVVVNDVELTPDRTEHVWDRTNVIYSLVDAVKSGENTIHWRGRIPSWEAAHVPAYAVMRGMFGVDADRAVIELPDGQMVPGSWTEQGYPDLSGTGVYRKEIQLDDSQAAASRAMLHIGQCRDVVELWCNGEQVGISLWNPHRFDLAGRLREGRNIVELRVANTLANLLEKTEPSGLTGEVVLKFER